jgi:hypothetical protein
MFSRTLITGAAALACLAGTALAADHPHGDEKKTTTTSSEVNVATYQVSDGEHEVRIIIKDGKPQIFLDGKPVDAEQVESRGGLWRIKGDDGETKARFFMQPRDGGGMTFRVGGDEGEEAEAKAGGLLREVVVGERRPVLGVMLESVDEATAKQLKIDADGSILVVGVAPDSGAANAGIKSNDIIVGIGGKDRGDLETIRTVLGEKKPGDEVKVVVLRGGEKETFGVRLKAAEGVEAPPAPEAFLREFEEQSRWGRGAEENDNQRSGGVVRLREAPRAELRARELHERERAVQRRVEELQQRLHAEQEAQREHQHRLQRLHEDEVEDEHRVLLELKKQDEFARRLDGLRKMRIEIDVETQKEIEEAMKRAAEALEDFEVDIDLPEIEFLGKGEGGNVLFLPEPPDAEAFGKVWRFRAPEAPRAPRAPRAPMAPGGQALYFGNAGGGPSLADIAERLARIEGILTGMAGKGGGCNCDCDCNDD